MHQNPRTFTSRIDHIWYQPENSDLYKCVLCGGITSSPPDFPTPVDWECDKYVELNDAERKMGKRKPPE